MKPLSREAPFSPEVAKPIEFAYTGDPELLRNFAYHAQAERDPQDHSRWVIVVGGGTRGALQAGIMTAAVETGFFYGATDGIGNSVGSAVLIEGAAKNTQASQIFYHDNLLNKFISFGIRRLAAGHLINFAGLEESFRNTYPLDMQTLRECPVSLHVGVTARNGDRAGESGFIDVRTHPDPVAVIMASVDLPFMGNIRSVPLERNGEIIHHNDIGMSTGDAITYAVEHGARDILFFLNEPFNPTKFQRMWSNLQHMIGKHVRHPFGKALLQTPKRGIEDMEKAMQGKMQLPDGIEVRFGFYGPTENRVKFMERNWQLLRRGVLDGIDQGMSFFGNLMQEVQQPNTEEVVA